MIKVLFICHGNICRSPMAEFVFKDMLARRGLEGEFEVRSAATSDEEIWGGVGNPVYPPARKELAKHGISCEGKRAVQLVRSDYGKYDYLIGMEQRNLRYMEGILGGDPEKKVYKLMDFTPEGGNIADPWYTGDFEGVYQQIVQGCEGFLNYLGK